MAVRNGTISNANRTSLFRSDARKNVADLTNLNLYAAVLCVSELRVETQVCAYLMSAQSDKEGFTQACRELTQRCSCCCGCVKASFLFAFFLSATQLPLPQMRAPSGGGARNAEARFGRHDWVAYSTREQTARPQHLRSRNPARFAKKTLAFKS